MLDRMQNSCNISLTVYTFLTQMYVHIYIYQFLASLNINCYTISNDEKYNELHNMIEDFHFQLSK